MIRRLLSLLALALALCTAASCSSPSWRPVNTAESERMAISRFNNFDRGTRPFATELTVNGAELRIQGWVDYVHHVGYATVFDPAGQPYLLFWDEASVGVQEGIPDRSGNPPLPLTAPSSETGWQIRSLDPTASLLDALLLILKDLGLDRPENPLLLVQAGALYLGDDTVEDNGEQVDVTIFAAPNSETALGPDDSAPTPEDATLKLWLDADNLMRRVEVLLGAQWVTIDMSVAEGPSLELP